ncbi:HD domain-containing protein [Wukongibacter baidiensis]|uniref:Ppx/GppA phosphatase family protein n=1 Tax=Wukongibacter baidiensis TaxID=1723361 RepID=UPI003D7F3CC1
MKNKIRTVSSIDVGSYHIRMVVAEINKQGEITILEELRRHTNIGKDTFSDGKINVETIHETCKILKKFAKVMKEYGVKHYRAVSTSGIREADNRSYVIEQIRMRTGLEVEIINNSEERFLTFKAIRSKLKDSRKMREEGVLVVNIGSGGVEFSAFKDGNLRFTSYTKVGSLRLRELLADLEGQTLDFPIIMEGFIESKTYLIESIIEKMEIKHFIGLGGGLWNILNICNHNEIKGESKIIDKKDIDKLYSDIATKSIDQIVNTFRLDYSEAQTLLPATIIFRRFLNITKAKHIFAPMVSLRHGILAEMVDEWFDTPRKKDFLNDIISSVKYIGEKYNYDEKHASHIQYLSTSIFDQLKKMHKLGEKDRLYLQVASLLHDVGKFVNLDKHHIYTYDIIKAQNIMGFSNRELNIIANIARYHDEENPKRFHDNYNKMDYDDQITISKLSAMLKIADALDITHLQKIRDVEVSHNKDEIYFKTLTKEDILLEKWAFMKNSGFFEEVMGMKALIKHKG